AKTRNVFVFIIVWIFSFRRDERLICCVTGPRRFPPLNHARSFGIFFSRRGNETLVGKAVAAVAPKRCYGRAAKAEGVPPVLRSNTAKGGQSKTLRDYRSSWEVRPVLECARPKALWQRARPVFMVA